MEIVGTIAFASSGVLVGIDKDMDIFGIAVLALTTAVGGGMIRDIMLGINPPGMFTNSIYSIVAIFTSIAMFVFFYFKSHLYSKDFLKRYNKLMNILDAIGLGVFTVVGIDAGIKAGFGENPFLLIFVGMITGVGGGLLRDVMSKDMPYIFMKHIYAVASFLGAVTCIVSIRYLGHNYGLAIGAILIIIIRMVSTARNLNLPKIKKDRQ